MPKIIGGTKPLRRIMTGKASAKDPLLAIPGVGASIAGDLRAIGIHKAADLKGRDPETLFNLSNKRAGKTQDRCLLYVFRCAVYFAEGGRNSAKLKWWRWKDAIPARRKH